MPTLFSQIAGVILALFSYRFLRVLVRLSVFFWHGSGKILVPFWHFWTWFCNDRVIILALFWQFWGMNLALALYWH
jgi:hypothetical protein